MAEAYDPDFNGVLPKIQTGAAKLHASGHLGEGITVAILDTGCDIGAEGLMKLPNGDWKYADAVDATGGGDVDMSVELKASENNTLQFPNKKVMDLPEGWTNPTGVYRYGVLHLEKIIPKGLFGRINKERAKKFNEQTKALDADIRQQIVEAKAKLESLKSKRKADPSGAELIDVKNASLAVTDLEDQLAQLAAFSGRKDVGLVYDCLVWHTGEEWLGCVVTEPDLGKCTPMTNFRVRNEYDTFSEETLCNYCLNTYDEGKVLCVVTHGGSHGTHVAGIVGAYYGDDSAMNGLAPACKLVSVRIGDGKLGTMETTKALIRALRVIVDNKCDLVNLSYGETTKYPNYGRLNDLMRTLVHDRGIIYVSSAGNSGPNLSTVGAPGGTNSSLISVGALVTPEIVDSCLGKADNVQRIQPFTWSSRGPCLDGARGVDISAPGAAITAVPQSTLIKNQYMNGTSKASTNACCSIDTLLSALQKEGVAYTPASVKRIVENTTTSLPYSPLTVGCGMINVAEAFKRFKSHPNHAEKFGMPLEFSKPGVIVANPADFELPNYLCHVQVKPKYPEDYPNEKKVQFELHCDLKATKPWVNIPSMFICSGDNRSIQINLDLEQLSAGYHYAEVQGFEKGNAGVGPMFRFPITVKKPECVTDKVSTFRLDEGKTVRTFLNPPPGARLCRVELEVLDEFPNMKVICFDINQVKDQEPVHINKSYFRAQSHGKRVITCECEPGRVVDVGVAQYALSFPFGTQVRQTVSFSGLSCPKEIFINGNAHVSEIQVNSNLKTELMEPRATLTHLLTAVPPSKAEISKLDERDLDITNLQGNQLVLEYKFDVAEKAEVWPTFPLLDELLYSGILCSQWLLFDSNKKHILTGDNWDVHKTTLDKQKGYTVQLQISSEDAKKLDALKAMRMVLRIAVKSKEDLPIYGRKNDAGVKTNKVTKASLGKGELKILFFGSVGDKKIPSYAKPGDVLEGHLLLQKDKKPSREHRRVKEEPGGVGEKCTFAKIFYTVPCKVPPAKKDDPPKEKDMLTNYIQGAIKNVKGLGKQEVQKEGFAMFVKPLMEKVEEGSLSMLRILQCEMELVAETEHQAKIQAAESIISQVDLKDLSAYFGVNHNDEFASDEEKLLKGRLEETKKILIAALKCQLKSQIDLDVGEKEIDECYSRCCEWIKKDDDSLAECQKYLAKQSKRFGTLLKLTYKGLKPAEKGDAKTAPSKKQHDEVLALLRDLGWDHIADRYETEREVCFPQSYQPF